MDFNIRAATENDFEDIFCLIKEFSVFEKTPEKVKISVVQMKADKDYFHCLVVENLDKTIIGFASYFIAYYSWIGKSLYLDDLYIKESYRGSKIGSMFMEKVFEIAKIENCKKVRWQVSNWNKKAIDFYRKLGATIDEVEINCDLILQ